MSFEFKKSTNKNKKYDVFLDGKKIASYGAIGYQHYFDKIGEYSELDHLDKERRKKYRERHSKILNKNGIPSYQVKYSPAWFSWHLLW